MKHTALTTRDDFELWLFSMPERLEEFLSQFSAEQVKALNYSGESLNVLEAWLLERYPDIDLIKQPSEGKQLDGAATYIGETIRKRLGGKWTINLDEPKKVFFGLPIIIDFDGYLADICPHTMTTASTDRRRGSYLYTIYKNLLRNADKKHAQRPC